MSFVVVIEDKNVKRILPWAMLSGLFQSISFRKRCTRWSVHAAPPPYISTNKKDRGPWRCCMHHCRLVVVVASGVIVIADWSVGGERILVDLSLPYSNPIGPDESLVEERGAG